MLEVRIRCRRIELEVRVRVRANQKSISPKDIFKA